MIVHNIILVIFLILINLIIAKMLYNKAMPKFKISLYSLDILYFKTNSLAIKYDVNILIFLCNIQLSQYFNSKAHTTLRASYNKA